MSESGKWTEVDYSDINGLTVEKNPSDDKVKFSLMLSPMDVPIAWRHSVEDQKIVIDFQYVSNGEALNYKDIGGISFALGKNSRRIYKILVDVVGLVSSGMHVGSIAFELKVAEATSELNNTGAVKRPNAKAIMNMLEHDQVLVTSIAAG